VEENDVLLLLQYMKTQRQKAKLLNSKWVYINKTAKKELNVIRVQNLKILVIFIYDKMEMGKPNKNTA
jgi:hypothetical protein